MTMSVGRGGAVRLRCRGDHAGMSTETADGSWMTRAGGTRAGRTRTAGPCGANATTAAAGIDESVSVDRAAARGIEAAAGDDTAAARRGGVIALLAAAAPDGAATARGSAAAARGGAAGAASTAPTRGVAGALRTSMTAM